MKFDLENLNPGVFFPFDEFENAGDGVEIRLASAEIMEIINKKCTKKRVEFRRGQRYEVIEEDEKKRSNMLWDYVILNWKGLEDQEGNPIECTTENKIKLMRGSVKFSGFIGDCIEKLSESSSNLKEESEKNL